MLNSPVVWQMTQEPSIEPMIRGTLIILVVIVSSYLTAKILLILGLTSRKTDGVLKSIGDALDRSDFSTLSKLVKNIPKNCPEAGLTELASATEVHGVRDMAGAFKAAELKFQAVMSQVSLYVQTLHSLVCLSLLGLFLWLVMRLHSILIGISAQVHLTTWVVASTLSEVMAGTAELAGIVSLLYLLKCVCIFRVSVRRVKWMLFLSSRADYLSQHYGQDPRRG